MTAYGIDLTACWRPRAGMVTAAVELTRALAGRLASDERLVIFASRERPAPVAGMEAEFVLSPHRHEILNKLTWFPAVEPRAGLDAILYPYWPPPPWRRSGAPPAVMLVNDLAFAVRPAEVPWQQRVYMGTLVPRGVRGSAAIVVPSRATGRDLVDRYGADPARIRLVEYSVAPLTPGPLPAGLEPGFLLAVGTIEPRKNYPRLLDAYTRLRAGRPATPDLVVAGMPGWAYGDALDRLRSTPGVRHLGHVDDATLGALYSNASLLAFPSLYEGFGFPLLEAMGAGIPALIGNRGSLPEVAAGAALEVDAERAEAIAEGLEKLLDDAGLRAGLVAAGRERLRHFTWERAGSELLEALREAAGRPGVDKLGSDG